MTQLVPPPPPVALQSTVRVPALSGDEVMFSAKSWKGAVSPGSSTRMDVIDTGTFNNVKAPEAPSLARMETPGM
jgi:hypothetical protein